MKIQSSHRFFYSIKLIAIEVEWKPKEGSDRIGNKGNISRLRLNRERNIEGKNDFSLGRSLNTEGLRLLEKSKKLRPE